MTAADGSDLAADPSCVVEFCGAVREAVESG